MRTINFMLATLFIFAVVACGGGYGSADYSAGNMGGGLAVYTISGTVTSGGNPLLGAMISLTGTRSTSTTTDGSGYYSFSNLPNGSYTVTPSATGSTFIPPSASVTISGNNPSGINFTS